MAQKGKSWYNPCRRRIPQETLQAHDLPMAMLDRRNECTTELLTAACRLTQSSDRMTATMGTCAEHGRMQFHKAMDTRTRAILFARAVVTSPAGTRGTNRNSGRRQTLP